MSKLLFKVFLLSLVTSLVFTEECDPIKVTEAKTQFSLYMKYLKAEIYKPYLMTTEGTQRIPSHDEYTHHSYDLEFGICNSIEISADFENPTCEQYPNPDIYRVSFTNFIISMTCSWVSSEKVPLWFNNDSDGTIFARRDNRVDVKLVQGEKNYIETHRTHGDVSPKNPFNDASLEFSECNNCKDYNKDALLEYFGVGLFYGESTILEKNFDRFINTGVRTGEKDQKLIVEEKLKFLE